MHWKPKKVRALTEVGKTSESPDGGSVVLVRGGALGDFVLTLPVAAALRAAHPGARLVVCGHADRSCLAAPDTVVDADGALWASAYGGQISPQLRARLGSCRALVAFIAAERPEAGPLAEALRHLCPTARLADPRPAAGDQRHMAAQLLDVVRPEIPGLPPTPVPRIHWAAAPRQELIILHPGSGSPAKCWPADRFSSLVTALRGRGYRCALLWGPAEAEREDEWRRHLPADVPRLSTTGAVDLARHLAAARLFVGNDSGPGHLAAAVGVPTVSLFGPTDAHRWRPLGPAATCLEAPQGDLGRLAVTQVLEVVEQQLQWHGGAT